MGDKDEVANALYITLASERPDQWLMQHTEGDYSEVVQQLDELSTQVRGTVKLPKPVPDSVRLDHSKRDAVANLVFDSWFMDDKQSQQVHDTDIEWLGQWASDTLRVVQEAVKSGISFASSVWLPVGAAQWLLSSRQHMSLLTNAAGVRIGEFIELIELHGTSEQHPITAHLRSLSPGQLLADDTLRRWKEVHGYEALRQVFLNFAYTEVESHEWRTSLARQVVHAGSC